MSMKSTVERKFIVSLEDAHDQLKKISKSNKNAKKELKVYKLASIKLFIFILRSN